MADITLHSGSFCDRNNDEIIITFFKKDSTPQMTVDPTSFEYGGTGSTNTFTFTGVPAAGLGYYIPSGVDWVTVSNLTNASVDITTSANQSPTSRTTTVKFYVMDDIDNYVTVTVNQEAGQASLSVTPSSITYLPAGGTYGITATWAAGTEPTATITYVQGEGGWMTPAGSGTVTGNTKEWAWTASANYTGSSRTALITVTNGLQSEYVTVSQSSASAALYVTPSSLSFVSIGETKTATVSNISGTLTTTKPSWITLAISGEGSSRTVGVTAASNTLSTSRGGSVIFDDDRQSPVTMAVSQEGAAAPTPTLSVSPTNIAYNPRGGTNGVTARWTVTAPSATLSYVQGESGWLRTISPVVSEGQTDYAWTAEQNGSTSARTAVVTISNGGEPEYVSITQSYYTMIISPVSISCDSSAQTVKLKVYYGDEYDRFAIESSIPVGSDFISISPAQDVDPEDINNYTHVYDVTISQNSTSSQRQGTIRFEGETGIVGTVSVTQASASFDYYVTWTPYLSSGTFTMDNSTYNFSDYSSNIFTDFSGVITSQAFMSTLISTLDTNASVIGSLAFAYCDNITSASLSQCKELNNTVFGECSRLSQVSLPICESIGYGVFQGCSSLESINLPACTKLSNNAFARCTNLSMVSIPLVQTISNRTFVSCSNLESVYAPSCVTVGSEAFLDCVGLISVDLPCNYVYQSAFENCTSLSYVNLPNCYAISERAFMNCTNLVSVSMPMIDYIGNSAFYDCTNLTYIDIYNCSSLGGNVFAGCTNLVSLSSPVLRNVGYRTFYNCVNLETVNLYGGYIGSYAFENCSILSIVTIGGAGRISNYAFYNCPSLSVIRLYSDTGFVSISQNTFSGTMITSSTGSIYVRNALLSVYKSAAYWSIYSSIILNLGF